MQALMRTAAAAVIAAALFGPAKADIKIGVAGPMIGPNAAYVLISTRVEPKTLGMSISG